MCLSLVWILSEKTGMLHTFRSSNQKGSGVILNSWKFSAWFTCDVIDWWNCDVIDWSHSAENPLIPAAKTELFLLLTSGCVITISWNWVWVQSNRLTALFTERKNLEMMHLKLSRNSMMNSHFEQFCLCTRRNWWLLSFLLCRAVANAAWMQRCHIWWRLHLCNNSDLN